MAFPAVFNINQLNGANGFAVEGINPFFGNGVGSGGAVSPVGDINGDGIADFAIGVLRGVSLAPGTNQQRFTTGEVYVVFGTGAGFPASVDPSALNGTNGFRIYGGREGQGLGFSVSGAGDVNNDGIDDLLLGTRATSLGQSAEPGEAFVVYGKTTPFAAAQDIYTFAAGEASRIADPNPSVPGQLGRSVTNIGDFNGDGIDDFAVGEAKSGNPFRATNEAGAVHVILGTGAGLPQNGTPAQFPRAVTYFGPLQDAGLGSSISGIGDFNGDGLDDFIAMAPGAPFRSPSERFATVVFGDNTIPASGAFGQDLTLLPQDASRGFLIRNLADQAGVAANAGDVNGDGLDDIIIGGPNAAGGTGVAYVIYGTRSPTFNLFPNTLDGTNGFVITGEGLSDFFGSSVHAAGDVNNDGYDDVIVGALGANRTPGSGAISTFIGGSAYVIYGGPSGGAASIDAATLNGTNGFKIEGISPFSVNLNDALGSAVSGGMDVNNDGIDDIIIGAPDATSAPGNVQTTAAGRSYVIFGQQGPLTVNGTGRDDVLRGAAGDDTMLGRGGDDLMQGLAGNDTMRGGPGDDTVQGGVGNDSVIGNSGNDSLSGQGGNDTLIGGSGFDTLLGGGGADNLRGGGGRDTVNGGAGNDVIRAEAGNDRLIDGAGRDRLFGGVGRDVFVLSSDNTTDFIQDFEDGVDRIELSGVTFGDLQISDLGSGHVRIRIGTEDLILIDGSGTLDASDLTVSDFVFV